MVCRRGPDRPFSHDRFSASTNESTGTIAAKTFHAPYRFRWPTSRKWSGPSTGRQSQLTNMWHDGQPQRCLDQFGNWPRGPPVDIDAQGRRNKANDRE